METETALLLLLTAALGEYYPVALIVSRSLYNYSIIIVL